MIQRVDTEDEEIVEDVVVLEDVKDKDKVDGMWYFCGSLRQDWICEKFTATSVDNGAKYGERDFHHPS